MNHTGISPLYISLSVNTPTLAPSYSSPSPPPSLSLSLSLCQLLVLLTDEQCYFADDTRHSTQVVLNTIHTVDLSVLVSVQVSMYCVYTCACAAISIDNVELKVVDSFKYLGSMISNDGSLDKEIASRISKASQALGRLRNRLLNHHNVTLDTKLKIYRAAVLSSLFYGCETWTVYRRNWKTA